MCIETKGNITARLSAEHMLGCCHTCGYGCASGFPWAAWKWLVTDGVVSGGVFGDRNWCSAYSLHPCEHYVNATAERPKCDKPLATPACPAACDAGTAYKTAFADDRHKFASTYSVSSDSDQIRTEIITRGPVTATMNVYEDFLYYKSGVYVAASGEELGGHAVKILGWGAEGGLEYWLCANSFNADWGAGGYFKIKVGDVGINGGVVAGSYLKA